MSPASVMRAGDRSATKKKTGTLCAQAAPSEMGWIAIAWRGASVVGVSFGRPSAVAAIAALELDGLEFEVDDRQQQAMQRLQDFTAGLPDRFLDIRLDLEGHTEFQRSVFHHCRRIPRGKTLTYAELAHKAGSPRAARAVGNVMATNRWPLIIPCHRVVGAGSLGGYSAPDGLTMKERLLHMEGAWPPKRQ